MTEDVGTTTGTGDEVSRALSAPPELRTARPDIADCVREARRQLAAQPQVDERGQHVVAGNTRTMTVGDRSAQLQAALAPVREAIYRATLTDLGVPLDGTDRPTEMQRMTARNLATLDVLAETFWTWIETRGVLTAKGKTRSAVMTLLSIIDRQQKVVAALGLTRRQRTAADMPIHEWLELEARRQQAQEGGQ